MLWETAAGSKKNAGKTGQKISGVRSSGRKRGGDGVIEALLF
jgi:hypothetical protein